MPDTKTLIDALASHLGSALGTMTGTAVRTMPTVGDATVDWQVPIQVEGSAVGTVWIGLSQDGATQLVGAVVGDSSPVADGDVVDTLKELVGQAVGAHAYDAGNGLTLTVETPGPVTAPVLADAQHYDLMIGAGDPIRLVGWGRTIAGLVSESARLPVPAPPAAPPVAIPIAAMAAPPPRNLDVVLDIELPITVRFGETQMTLESLARLGPGSMIDLARSPDDPVDVLVNGHLVARGQVVVVSGCYGVRVSEVVSPADRLRSLEF